MAQLADGTIVKRRSVLQNEFKYGSQSYTLQETYLLTPTIEIIK